MIAIAKDVVRQIPRIMYSPRARFIPWVATSCVFPSRWASKQCSDGTMQFGTRGNMIVHTDIITSRRVGLYHFTKT
jgi:hypothetical protein